MLNVITRKFAELTLLNDFVGRRNRVWNRHCLNKAAILSGPSLITRGRSHDLRLAIPSGKGPLRHAL